MVSDRLTQMTAAPGVGPDRPRSSASPVRQPPVLHYCPGPRRPRRRKAGLDELDLAMPVPFIYRLFRMSMWL